MMLLRDATEHSLKIEALSLITSCCTSTDTVNWAELRESLEAMMQEAPPSELSYQQDLCVPVI